MPKLTEYELERQANIARNLALFNELNLKEAAAGLISRKEEEKKEKPKPVQSKRPKREKPTLQEPRRQSLRLRSGVIDVNESPAKRQKRLEEAEKQRQKEEEERLAQEEREREAKKPRHYDLDLLALTELEKLSDAEFVSLTKMMDNITREGHPRRIADHDAFTFENKAKEEKEVVKLRQRLGKMKIVSRAKVTQDRIYSAAYHPEKTKDLVFFGDKHGQLGIWDARAPPDEVADEDGDISSPENGEGGKYWRLQPHWPATSQSSISSIKIDPIDAHKVYTSAYDCTLRSTSLVNGLSQEVFAMKDVLLTSFDLPPTGSEMWIADATGGLTHLDLREDRSNARRWALSEQKIGCVSVNPTSPNLLLLASNDRHLRIWDARMLSNMRCNRKTHVYPPTNDFDDVQKYGTTLKGSGILMAEFSHGKSVSAAYWDPRGRSIVSTSYDDKLRIWDVVSEVKKGGIFKSFKPAHTIQHNCQTGRWVTVLKAQWSLNPDVYPHFSVGNMNHSLDIFGCKGELLARLSDLKRVTAVQAVTCSHPSIVERAVSGNASGRCSLWATPAVAA